MIKANLGNKIVNVIEVKAYDNGYNEKGSLVEVFFKNEVGTKIGAIIKATDLIDERDELTKIQDNLIKLVSESYNCNVTTEGEYIFFEGNTYVVNVFVDTELKEFNMDTKHYERSKHYGLYEEEYKNYAVRKTVKGALNYIGKFLD